jgi:ribosome-binding factor A
LIVGFLPVHIDMPSLRHQRVRELLKRQIGEVLRREIQPDASGLITVNEVGLAGDLKSATVFVGVVGNPDQQRKAMALLGRQRARLQTLVAREVILKYMPRLRFVLDESIERGNRVLAIMEELKLSEPEIESDPEA